MTADEPVERVEAQLRSYGVSVESLSGGDPLELTYMTAFPGRTVHRREIGRALNALIDRADADAWDPVRVEATVVRSPGDPLGSWVAEGEWFAALLDDDITETEFSGRVLDTIDHVEEPDSGPTEEPSADDRPGRDGHAERAERDEQDPEAETDDRDGAEGAVQ